MGSDKNRNPMTAVDNTKRLSITMGISKVLPGKTEVMVFIRLTIKTIYTAATNAYKNGFFIPLEIGSA